MDNIQRIIKEKEGRRLEFKDELPSNADLAKTIISFANVLDPIGIQAEGMDLS